MGILFSVFGSIHDQLTVTISPEYYAIGKGVGFDSLRLKASFVGLKSGMYAGIVFGCLFLFLNKSWNSTTLYSWLKVIAIFSLISLVLGAIIGYIVSLFGVNVTSAEVENTQYLIVLGWHIGLYGGAVLGLLFQALKPAFVAKFYTQKITDDGISTVNIL